MKIFFSACLFVLLFLNVGYSQNASTYFPSNTGYKWYFKNTLLDSLNNPQPSLATFQIDSFAIIQNYRGLLASIVLSKIGLININQNAPYIDSSFYNFQTTNAWKYLKLFAIDTFGINIGIINFLKSFEKWYSTYMFAQNVNTNYTIVSKDTTIAIDTLTLPLRVSSIGRRLNDQNVNTVNGNYLAKKFVITNSLFYLLTIPPFPTIAIPIIQQSDTSWIAQNVWVVKEMIPSIRVDLTPFGVPISFSIPGNLKELTSPTIGINNNSIQIANEYKLFQNYPNPFNPATIIEYNIPKGGFVTLSIYDVNGKELLKLINQKQKAGYYQINFKAQNLESGTYFYKLTSNNYIETKKMILIK